MRSPCGDHAGLPSFSPYRVSRRGAHEAVGSSHRLLAPRYSSIEYEVTVQTAAEPSGEIATSATRSSRHSASTSSGCRAPAPRRRRAGPSALAIEGGFAQHRADLHLVLLVEIGAALLLRLHVLGLRRPCALRFLVAELDDRHALAVLRVEALVRDVARHRLRDGRHALRPLEVLVLRARLEPRAEHRHDHSRFLLTRIRGP